MLDGVFLIMLIAIIIVLILTFIALKQRTEIRITKEVCELFGKSSDSKPQTFTYDSIRELPDPVQRYFKLVLREGQPVIESAKVLYAGKFKTGLRKNWINIHGKNFSPLQTPACSGLAVHVGLLP